MKSQTVIDTMEAFVKQRPESEHTWRVVILDNARIHHSEDFRQRIEDWLRRRVYIHYLPAYSPELNAIEIVWRFIKYQWLPVSAYSSLAELKKTLHHILDGIGSKYKITFA